MEKYCIYKYTNIINGKKYIGQTNNIKRRIREHRNAAKNILNKNISDLLTRAMNKYGEDNFTIEVIESDILEENIDERERYWISLEKCLVPNGYNILIGGKHNFNNSKFSQQEIKEIKEDILSGKTYKEINDKWNISYSFISNINHGHYFHDCNTEYPLSKKQDVKEDERVQRTIYLLKNTKLTLEEIAKEVGYSTKGSVTKINNGSFHFNEKEKYPIRETKASKNRRAAELLVGTNLNISEIAKQINLSETTVRNLIVGKYRKYEDYIYPLR